MAETFNEKVFVWSLTARPEDCKAFAQKFKPEWLWDKTLSPVLAEVYDFMREHGVPPTIPALHDRFRDRDTEGYENRMRPILDDLQTINPDVSVQIHHLSSAANVAVIRSLQEMMQDNDFLVKQTENEGQLLIQDVNRWVQQHTAISGDVTRDLDEAVSYLMTDTEFDRGVTNIATGLDCIDEWCGTGLRPGQLGIVLAPTGHGKSVFLSMIARRIAMEHPVWMVSNELTIAEITERFLAGLLDTNISTIIRDPLSVRKQWEDNWKGHLANRLWISEYNRDVSADDLEAAMLQRANITGVKPRVMCLDFMERMKPNDAASFKKDASWNWIGAIATDLVRLAKRHKMLIWTAAQTNRSGLNSKDIELEQTQGSIKHLQEASAVISMLKVPGENKASSMKFKPIKMRSSKGDYAPKWVKADLAKMKILNVEDLEAAAIEYERAAAKHVSKEQEKQDKKGYNRSPKYLTDAEKEAQILKPR